MYYVLVFFCCCFLDSMFHRPFSQFHVRFSLKHGIIRCLLFKSYQRSLEFSLTFPDVDLMYNKEIFHEFDIIAQEVVFSHLDCNTWSNPSYIRRILATISFPSCNYKNHKMKYIICKGILLTRQYEFRNNMLIIWIYIYQNCISIQKVRINAS